MIVVVEADGVRSLNSALSSLTPPHTRVVPTLGSVSYLAVSIRFVGSMSPVDSRDSLTVVSGSGVAPGTALQRQ